MKKLIFLFSILFSLNLYSESLLENFKYEHSIRLDIPDITKFDLITKYNNGNIYIFIKQIEKDEKGNYFNYLFKFDEKTKDYKIFKIENNRKCYTNNIDVNDRYFTLLSWDSTLIYKWKDDNYYYEDNFIFKGWFDNIVIDNDFIILYDCGIASSTMNEDTQTHLIKYDLKKEKNVIDELLPNPEGFQFTFFGPRNLIEANSNFTLVADANNYKIKVYNSKNEVTDEIARNDVDWKTHPTTDSILKSIDITNTEIKYEIDKLRPFTGLISLIHRMSFINDSTFVLLWSKPKAVADYFLYFDIWGFRNGKWNLLKSDLQQDLEENAQFSFDKLPIYNITYSISNSKLFVITNYPFDLEEENYKTMTFAELKKQTDEYYKKNDLSFTIIVYEYVEK